MTNDSSAFFGAPLSRRTLAAGAAWAAPVVAASSAAPFLSASTTPTGCPYPEARLCTWGNEQVYDFNSSAGWNTLTSSNLWTPSPSDPTYVSGGTGWITPPAGQGFAVPTFQMITNSFAGSSQRSEYVGIERPVMLEAGVSYTLHVYTSTHRAYDPYYWQSVTGGGCNDGFGNVDVVTSLESGPLSAGGSTVQLLVTDYTSDNTAAAVPEGRSLIATNPGVYRAPQAVFLDPPRSSSCDTSGMTAGGWGVTNTAGLDAQCVPSFTVPATGCYYLRTMFYLYGSTTNPNSMAPTSAVSQSTGTYYGVQDQVRHWVQLYRSAPC